MGPAEYHRRMADDHGDLLPTGESPEPTTDVTSSSRPPAPGSASALSSSWFSGADLSSWTDTALKGVDVSSVAELVLQGTSSATATSWAKDAGLSSLVTSTVQVAGLADLVRSWAALPAPDSFSAVAELIRDSQFSGVPLADAWRAVPSGTGTAIAEALRLPQSEMGLASFVAAARVTPPPLASIVLGESGGSFQKMLDYTLPKFDFSPILREFGPQIDTSAILGSAIADMARTIPQSILDTAGFIADVGVLDEEMDYRGLLAERVSTDLAADTDALEHLADAVEAILAGVSESSGPEDALDRITTTLDATPEDARPLSANDQLVIALFGGSLFYLLANLGMLQFDPDAGDLYAAQFAFAPLAAGIVKALYAWLRRAQ